MKFIKKLSLLFAFFLLITSLYGCWDYRELNNLLVVSGAAVDKNEGDDGYTLTLEVFQPNSSGESLNSEYVQIYGKTIFEAIRNSINNEGKRLYWGHTKIFFISKAIANEDIVPVLDLLDRDDEIRPDVFLVITKTPKAYDIFKTKIPQESISFKTEGSLINMKSSGKYTLVDLHEFIEALSLEGMSSVLPAISIKKCCEEYKATFTGNAVFKKNKLVGWLSKDEAIIYNILYNKKFSGLITVKENIQDYIKYPKEDTINVTFEVLNTKAKIKPKFIDDNIVMDIEVEIECNIAEIDGYKVNFIDKKNREILKKHAEKDIKNRIEQLIYKSQYLFNSDFLGFSRKIKSKYPKYWDKNYANWDKDLSNIKTNINVKYKIKGSALFKNVIEVK